MNFNLSVPKCQDKIEIFDIIVRPIVKHMIHLMIIKHLKF